MIEAAVDDLIVDGRPRRRRRHRATAGDLAAGAVVLTTGTFLRGLIHIGEQQDPGGPRGRGAGARPVASGSTGSGFALGRLKTGTPPRLDGRHHRLGRACERSRATIRRCRSPS